ncbi:33360_t:CDS:2, partial [Racocetra persica]
ANNLPHTGISKRRPLEMLTISNIVFEQASELCVGMNEIKKESWIKMVIFTSIYLYASTLKSFIQTKQASTPHSNITESIKKS